MKGCIVPKILSFKEVIGTYEKTRGGITASVYVKKYLGCGLCVCSCAQKALYLEVVDCISRMARG